MAITLNTSGSFPNASPRANIEGATVEVFCDCTFDASYPNTGTFATSGYLLTPASLGLTEILYLDVGSLAGYVPHYDYANQNLHLFQQSAATGKLTEVPNTTDLHLVTGRLMVIGKGFATIGLK